MKNIKYFVAIVLLLIVFSCHKAENKSAQIAEIADDKKETGFDNNDKNKTDNKKEEKVNNYTTDSIGSPSEETTDGKKPSKEPIKTSTDWDKKIIKTAQVSLDVKDYNTFNKNLHGLVKRYGAYVAGEEQNQNNYSIENNVIIKVPVEQFDDLMNSLAGDGIKVVERKISTEDVTSEVVDTKGRIEAKKAVRQQYITLLNQAKNMHDILEVQNEINSITEELETASGRVKYLVHQAAYSTIHLKYYQYFDESAKPETEPNFFTKLKDAFVTGAKGVGNFFVLLITLWPLILIGIGIWVGIKKWKGKSFAKMNSK